MDMTGESLLNNFLRRRISLFHRIGYSIMKTMESANATLRLEEIQRLASRMVVLARLEPNEKIDLIHPMGDDRTVWKVTIERIDPNGR